MAIIEVKDLNLSFGQGAAANPVLSNQLQPAPMHPTIFTEPGAVIWFENRSGTPEV